MPARRRPVGRPQRRRRPRNRARHLQRATASSRACSTSRSCAARPSRARAWRGPPRSGEGARFRARPVRRGRAPQRLHDPGPDRRRARGGVRPHRGSACATRASRSSPSLAETEAAAIEAVARVRLDLEELPAVFDVEEALAPGAPVVTHWGNNTFMYEGHAVPPRPLRRCRGGLRAGRPHRRRRLPHEPHRARAHRDDGLHRAARAERPVHGLHQHPGAVLQPRQHLDHPERAGQSPALHRRHGRWRLRWQGRRHRRAARYARGDEDRPARSATSTTARRRCRSRRRAARGEIYRIKDGVMCDGRLSRARSRAC